LGDLDIASGQQRNRTHEYVTEYLPRSSRWARGVGDWVVNKHGQL